MKNRALWQEPFFNAGQYPVQKKGKGFEEIAKFLPGATNDNGKSEAA